MYSIRVCGLLATYTLESSFITDIRTRRRTFYSKNLLPTLTRQTTYKGLGRSHLSVGYEYRSSVLSPHRDNFQRKHFEPSEDQNSVYCAKG